MSNLLSSFDTVAPIFLLVGIGWLIRKLGWVDEHFIGAASKLNFRICLPALLFLSIYKERGTNLFDWRFVGFMSAGCLIVALILFLTVPRFVKDKSKASAIIHTIFKPNIIVLGFPMAIMAFGEEHASAISMILPVLTPLNNIAAVLILCALDPQNQQNRPNPLTSSLKSIMKNPIIISAVAAILVNRFAITLPNFLFKLVSYLSNMATPFALVILGTQMTMKSVLSNRRHVVFATLCKVIVVPAIMVPLAYYLGFRGYELATAFIIFASPSAVNSYMLAREMHSDEVLTGEIILSSTLCSMFILFIGIFILKKFLIIP